MKIIHKDSSDEEIREYFNLDKSVKIISSLPVDVKDGEVFCQKNGELLSYGREFCVQVVKYNKRTNCFVRHNTNGPVWVNYVKIDKVLYISYYVDGRPHRYNGPAKLRYKYDNCDKNINLSLIKETYLINNKVHSINGPASRDLIRGCWLNKFYINNRQLSLDSYCKLKEKRMYENNGRNIRSQQV